MPINRNIKQGNNEEKSKEEVTAQREAKKHAKQAAKKNKKLENKSNEVSSITEVKTQDKEEILEEFLLSNINVEETSVPNKSQKTKEKESKSHSKGEKPIIQDGVKSVEKCRKLETKSKAGTEKPKLSVGKEITLGMNVKADAIIVGGSTTEQDFMGLEQLNNPNEANVISHDISSSKPENLILEETGFINPSKSKEEVMAEREMRKKMKAAKKEGNKRDGQEDKTEELNKTELKPVGETITLDTNTEGKPKEKSKAELRAERRALQEKQRAAKEAEKQQKTGEAQKLLGNKDIDTTESKTLSVKEKKSPMTPKTRSSRIKLFGHLQYKNPPKDINLELDVHPAIIALGAKYAARVINGSNARCLAFLQAIKQMISDYSTPPEKEFSRGLEEQIVLAVSYLKKFRPLSVSIVNALRHIKSHLTQLPNNVSDDEARTKLCDVIDIYIREQIEVAALAISKTMQRKIANGDVILTYACSSLLWQLLVESKTEGTDFSVIVVDAGPWFEGKEMIRRLTEKGISCSYVLINALSFIMRKVTTVLIGAHALLANGYVMSRAGSSLIALMAHTYNVPVLVCCETHKFSERVQTDVFVYNELGDPDEIVSESSVLADWRSRPSLSPLNLLYDITPPDLVTAVVTELAILPCTSVPVVLRVKPSDLTT